jgi:LPXTG-motif cell wall-anchored protein
LKRTTATLLTGALATGSALALSFAVPGIAAASGCGTTTVTDQDLKGWDLTTETRTAGGHEFTGSGLRVFVTAQSTQGKSAGYRATGGVVPLEDYTAQSNFVIETNLGTDEFPPGFSYQLAVDKDGNGAFDQYLVYEPDSYGAGVWHTNTGGAELGYEFTGDLDRYVDLHPSAGVLGFGYSYGSGVPAGEVTVESLSFGCNVFAFESANRNPVVDFTWDDAGDSDWRTIALTGTASDPDGDEITYVNWTYGDGSGGGGDNPRALNRRVVDYAAAGNYTVTLTVRDSRGGEATVTKTVTIRANDTAGGALPNTGADVMGLAAIGAVVLTGGAVGAVATRRRRSAAQA